MDRCDQNANDGQEKMEAVHCEVFGRMLEDTGSAVEGYELILHDETGSCFIYKIS